MRFRLPEIFLGCFLTVAVFTMGFLFASSEHPETPQQAHTTQTAESKSQKDLTDERLADYTFLLAWFTGVLAVSTVGLWIVTWRAGRSQSRDMQESLRLTAIAASATDRSARAAIALQLPIIRIKPDNLGHGDTQLAAGQKFEECFVPGVVIANLGPTKALPLEILYGFTIGNELPPEPSYRFIDGFLTNTIFEPDIKTTPRKNLRMAMPLKPGQWADILKGNYLWFYCALRYEDFMGEIHTHGFCWRWAYVGAGLDWRGDDTPAYNRKA